MDPVFKEELSVRLNEVDHRGEAKLPHIFNWFQNISSKHSSIVGYPVTQLIKKNLTWVVTRYHLKVKRYPRWRENLTISTWRSGEKENFAPREFQVQDENKEKIISCTSSFKLIDLKKKKSVSPKLFLPDYPVLEKREIDDEFHPMEDMLSHDQEIDFIVRRDDLDINRHLNNTLYIQWALENIPENIHETHKLTQLEIGFKKETFYKEKVVSLIQAIESENDRMFIHNIVRKKDNLLLAELKTRWINSKF